MVSTPGVIPVTTPLEEPIVAIDELLELHVPVLEFVNNVTEPTHTLLLPPIAPGVGSTVTINIDRHPVAIYV